ncbi:MAG: ABC transporter ATP-binding protein [Desulfobacteraceae bacterium]|jgi:iron complex transport system ATP-binding protein
MTLKVKDLYFNYNKSEVLRDINLDVEKGEVASLVGPNGAGKSTLLKCMNRILRPDKGNIMIDGEDLENMSLKKMACFLGYVPQTAYHTFPSTVFETVLLGRRPYVNWTVGPENRDIVYEMLIAMNLDHLALRQFNEISGGEQQRALIARALAQEPRVLLLDEPTSNLDLRHQLEVLDHVVSIVKEKGISVIMAIHDLNLASRYSDRIIFLNKGEIHMSGTPEETLVSKNIRKVYEVETMVNNDSGRPHIVPVGVSVN